MKALSKNHNGAARHAKATQVQLFVPCFVDQLFPDTAFNMIRVLEKAGCHVSYNESQTYCGQPLSTRVIGRKAGRLGRNS